jgi:hypothetical protein
MKKTEVGSLDARLKSSIQRLRRRARLSDDPEIMALAKKATTKHTCTADINEWAERLSNDVSDAND